MQCLLLFLLGKLYSNHHCLPDWDREDSLILTVTSHTHSHTPHTYSTQIKAKNSLTDLPEVIQCPRQCWVLLSSCVLICPSPNHQCGTYYRYICIHTYIHIMHAIHVITADTYSRTCIYNACYTCNNCRHIQSYIYIMHAIHVITADTYNRTYI